MYLQHPEIVVGHEAYRRTAVIVNAPKLVKETARLVTLPHEHVYAGKVDKKLGLRLLVARRTAVLQAVTVVKVAALVVLEQAVYVAYVLVEAATLSLLWPVSLYFSPLT